VAHFSKYDPTVQPRSVQGSHSFVKPIIAYFFMLFFTIDQF